jgi:hypothetical protein
MKIAIFSLLLFSARLASAVVDLGAPAGFTPYDAYMHPVKQVLNGLTGESADMDKVRALMREGRNFRYSYTDPYNAALPAVTAATHAGDCKAKALWLCDQMNDQNVRFVVGKTNVHAKLSHAWVMWQHEGRWWILDCTNTSMPIPADRVPNSQYIPLYSWSKSGEYRHASTQIGLADVATTRNVPVASQTASR